jgi:hypothetical protein
MNVPTSILRLSKLGFFLICIHSNCYCTGQAGTTESSRLQKQRSTQSTAHSLSNIKCNLSVTITKSSPWRWPSRVETCRSVLRLMIKTLFVNLLVISVFVHFTVFAGDCYWTYDRPPTSNSHIHTRASTHRRSGKWRYRKNKQWKV